MWDTACLDWERRLLAGESLVPTLPLFPAEAAAALRTFKRLHIPDVIGRPTLGEIGGPWLFPIVEAIFGSYDEETNKRMIQEFFWMIPKKNGKSSTAAAIMVEALILNRRPEGEFVLIAPTKEIADIAFKQAHGTIAADPALAKTFHAQRHIRQITHRLTGASLKVKAADTDVITGGKQVGTMIDELHVLADKPQAADIMIEIRGALAARPDGFLIIVTTQSKRPPIGVFKSELERARDIRDGKVKAPVLPIIYELPYKLAAKEGWADRKYWPLINPNLNKSVSEDFLVEHLDLARSKGGGEVALFASQHFNAQIGLSLHDGRWAGVDFWEAAVDRTLTLESLIRRSEVATVGVDPGGLYDLSALGVIGRERGTRRWLAWVKAWAHISLLAKQKNEAARLIELARAGELVIVDAYGAMDPADVTIAAAEASMMQGSVEMEDDVEPFDISRAPPDIEEMVAIVSSIDKAGILSSIGVDPNGVGTIVDALAEIGINAGDEEEDGKSRNRIVGVSQGWRLTGAIKTVERKLADGTLRHADQAILRWCVSNAKIEPRGNATLITKQASGSAKIDPLMALFDAAWLMAGNPEPPNPESVYNSIEKRPTGFLCV